MAEISDLDLAVLMPWPADSVSLWEAGEADRYEAFILGEMMDLNEARPATVPATPRR